jgi:hypothetical protein
MGSNDKELTIREGEILEVSLIIKEVVNISNK